MSDIKPALMILGMHRSYTSLVSRWLQRCGLDLGERILPGGVGNDDGHFEDLDFHDLHVDALARAGLPRNGMVDLWHPHFDGRAYAGLVESERYRHECTELLKQRSHSEPLIWKEPRTCLFLPHYREALDARCLILFRPYDEVVASLLKREPEAMREFTFQGWRRPFYRFAQAQIERQVPTLRDGFLRAWIFYNQCLLDHIERSDPEHLMIHDLESLMDQASQAIDRLNEWGFACEYQSLKDLVRHRKSENPVYDFNARDIEQAEAISLRFRELIGG